MKKISNFLFLAVIISCSQSGNSIDEILQEEARSINSNVETTTTVKNFYELDTLYRDGSDFKLPTFNANCTHAVSEIVKLFDFWNEEYNLNLSYDILGQPVLGSGSELQMEKCVEKIVGSNKDQNVSLKGNEHIELVVGKKYDITPFSEVSLSVQTILVSSFPNYGPISIALHPTNPDLDLISDSVGLLIISSAYTEFLSTVSVPLV